MDDRLFSVKEAAARLACSEAMLRKWLCYGKLPYIKVGRLTRIRQQDLEAWVRLGLQPVRKDGQQ
jgi:excisionase family DNA binding protein